ncbi:MAG: hypothetical protein LUG44_05440 [Clostridiales bacterium]|nr:hypothetical protein [Clostridiales bacterium]
MKHEQAAIILFFVTVLSGAVSAFAGFLVAIFGAFHAGSVLWGFSVAWWVLAWMSVRWMA